MEFLSHHRGIVHLIKRLIYLGITLIDIATKCDRIFESLLQSQYSLPSGSGMAFLMAINAVMISLISNKVTKVLN
ncbi:hypothetical protein WEU38_02650 [Cyanobacterium aponinum AL20118]|uniref:Uncharacterized protein n=1 Tax=Cyanobacterium aponinum AL20115 TaxID=3090662 RepID=A0AAF0ZFC4_9CHRO|nr:hypothetical protein [Cyanobacterium aponinum]WPF89195.1 hypothetical protein SAY89_02665 [Cyanobacterium aponinum AL20115]